MTTHPENAPGRVRRDPILLAIAAFKLLKAAVLVTLGVVGMVASPATLYQRAEALFASLHPGRQVVQSLVQSLLGRLGALHLATEKHLALASLGYAAAFLVEGTGLLLERAWAEWMTVIVTASFIPLELYELHARFSGLKLATLMLNGAVVAYLLRRRLQRRHAPA